MRGVGGVVAVALVVAACSGADDDAAPTSTTARGAPATTAPDTEPAWELDETATGFEVDAGHYRLIAETDHGLRTSVTSADGDLLVGDAVGAAGGLFLVRGETTHRMSEVTDVTAGEDRVLIAVAFDSDGPAAGAPLTGTVEIAAAGDRMLTVRLTPDEPDGVTAWGTSLGLQDGELIYGLTERIVDDWGASENIPQEVGSLDRRGGNITMAMRPTMSGYAPFHQSSAGYGLLVDGFMPGAYAVGASAAPDVLSFQFEIEPGEEASGYHVLVGPDHPTILEQYYELTGYPRRPPDEVFRHWRGRDELPIAEPGTFAGVEMNASVASDLMAYERYGLPAGVYHFDRPWAVGQEGFGELAFDPARFPNTVEMLEVMAERGWSTTVWLSPWAIGARGEEAAANGWLAPGSPRAIDLTNAEAVEWLRADILDFLASDAGQRVDGFFMDRGDEPDVSTTAADIYADGSTGRQMLNRYPVEFGRILGEVIEEARPDDGFLIARPGYTGSQQWVMRWGGDTRSRDGLPIPELPDERAPTTDLGLRSVLISVQRAAFMGTPYWGSDIGGYSAWNDADLYARWIQVGFASPLMRFHGMGGTPWATTMTGEPDQELIDIYRRYVLLRHDPAVQTYLADAAGEAATSGQPMVRPLVFEWPDQRGARNRWDQWLLGPDLLVAPVWRIGERERTVWIPPGEWVPFWDRKSVVEGPTEITVDAPLDQLPMFVRPESQLLTAEPI